MHETDTPRTTQEAAEYLGVSVQTIYILVRAKRLKAFRPGSKELRFDLSELERYKASRNVR